LNSSRLNSKYASAQNSRLSAVEIVRRKHANIQTRLPNGQRSIVRAASSAARSEQLVRSVNRSEDAFVIFPAGFLVPSRPPAAQSADFVEMCASAAPRPVEWLSAPSDIGYKNGSPS
jgi:hypothetical protein